MNLPRHAAEIVRARENGMKPVLPVIVSCVGDLRRIEINPSVEVTGPVHDWAFLAGLDVYVFVAPLAEHVQETLRGLMRVVRYIGVWDVQAKRGMDLWPVWKGANVPEVPGFCGAAFDNLLELSLHERRDAIFLRWARMTWLEGENARFAGCN